MNATKRHMPLLPFLAFLLAAAAAPSQAASGATVLEERFKSALNGMVRSVEEEPDAAQRRELLLGFTSRLENGLREASVSASLKAEESASLAALGSRFHAYHAELAGSEGFARVADEDLGRYAAYIQQDLEQAPVGGGVYISGGALLVILILILLLS